MKRRFYFYAKVCAEHEKRLKNIPTMRKIHATFCIYVDLRTKTFCIYVDLRTKTFCIYVEMPLKIVDFYG